MGQRNACLLESRASTERSQELVMSWIIAVSQYLLLVFLLAIAVALTMMATLFLTIVIREIIHVIQERF